MLCNFSSFPNGGIMESLYDHKKTKAQLRLHKETLWMIFLTSALSLAACTKNEKKIVGTIKITPELQKKISPDAVLYIVAKKSGQTAGPPVAVRRMPQPLVFPIEFQILPQDTMFPDAPFEGTLSISARIAQNGSATPPQTGDIVSSTPSLPAEVGAKTPILIELNRTL
jgi:hypothetical protein